MTQKLTERQVEAILNSSKKHFEDLGWEQIDTAIALVWLIELLLIFKMKDFPTDNSKFPEVLRATANTIELVQRVK